jgi:hypothetical protein
MDRPLSTLQMVLSILHPVVASMTTVRIIFVSEVDAVVVTLLRE